MRRMIMKSTLLVVAGILAVAASAKMGKDAVPKAKVLFTDTFGGTGALGTNWDTWLNSSGGAKPVQSGGCLVFGRSSSTSWSQAAVQTAKPLDIASCNSVKFEFRIKDFGGSSCDAGIGEGETSFIMGEYDKHLGGLHDASLEGLVLKIEQSAINFGSWPDSETDSRTWVEIRKTDDTLLEKIVVRSTNDFTLIMTLASTWWSLDVEGALFWMESGRGEASGRHGYDLSTWSDGASLRIESWNAEGKFPPVSIESVSIQAYR